MHRPSRMSPEISVLIPAFRARHLDLTIASILAQSYTNFELIISDDSDGPDVEDVVSKWSDNRMRYVRNPDRQVPGANRDNLILLAEGRYIKFVFDDDFLLPQSLEVLEQGARLLAADLVFHARYFVDECGRRLGEVSVVPAGQAIVLDSSLVFVNMVGGAQNFIGEPSNIMIRTDMLREMANPFGVDGDRMRFLTDVALYLNVAAGGRRLVGTGYTGSAFRLHRDQTSAVGGPAYSAGLFEWELFARWAADHGYLDRDSAVAAISARRLSYLPHAHDYPELFALASVPPDPGPQELFLDQEFTAVLRAAWSAVDQRNAQQKLAA